MIEDLTEALQARAEELRGAAEELERIEAALAALRGSKTVRTDGRPRHPGGQQALVLEAAAEAPGSTGAQLAVSTGVGSPAIYAVIRRLVDLGQLRRDDDKRLWVV